jgi:hypothetical protein
VSQGPDEDAFADVLNGITGGGSRRSGERRGFFGRRRKIEDEAEDSGSADRDAGRAPDGRHPVDEGGAHRSPSQGVPVGPPSGPQQGSWRPDTAGRPDEDGRPRRPGDTSAPTTPGGIPVADQYDAGPPDYPDGPRGGSEPPESSFVRPYAWTRGRTRPAYDLAVETLLSTTAQGRDHDQVTQYEHRMIADLCREPKSVAEVGALLSLPLGVARVLLGDMAAHGSIVVHETASSTGDAPDMALMERVLSGLRRL